MRKIKLNIEIGQFNEPSHLNIWSILIKCSSNIWDESTRSFCTKSKMASFYPDRRVFITSFANYNYPDMATISINDFKEYIYGM